MSDTAPLPQPKAVQLAPLDLLLMATANATNGTNPHIVSGVAATSPDISTAASQAQGASQLSNIQDVVQNLGEQSIKQQQAAWKQTTKSDQQQLISAGYTPPAQPSRSLFGDITHAAGDVFHAGSDVLQSAPVSDTLKVAGAPLRLVQHVERTAFANNDLSNAQQFKDLFSVPDWEKAWNETSNGEQYIDPKVKSTALNQYGQDAYNLAYQLATGKSAAEILAATPQANQQAVSVQLQSKAVQDATRTLNAGHLTLGHDIVGFGNIANHPEAGNLLSGLIDGVFDWFADPVNIAGKTLGEYKGVKYVVSCPEDVQTLFDKMPSVQRGFTRIADAVRSGSAMAVQDVMPQAKQAAQELVAAQADTTGKVLEYFKEKAWEVDTLRGSPTNAISDAHSILPHLSNIGYARQAAKGNMIKAINWAVDRPFNINSVNPDDFQWSADDVLHHISQGDPSTSIPRNQIVAQGLKEKSIVAVGRLARQATTLAPSYAKGFFNPSSPDAANVLRDIGLGFMPAKVVDQAVTAFAHAQDLGTQWKIYRSLMLQMASAAGVDRDSDLWNTYFSKFASDDPGVVYAAQGRDIKYLGGQRVHVGVYKQDMSTGWSIPDYRELKLHAMQAGVTNSITKGVNAEWMDSFMNKWRPLTLAHIGFAFRVGGEEAFGFGLREGFGNYLRAAAARVSAKVAQAGIEGALESPTDDEIVDGRLAGVWNRMGSHLPTHIQDSIQTADDLFRENMVDRVKRAYARTADVVSTDHMRDSIAAYAAQEGSLATPDEISGMHGWDPGKISGEEDGSRLIKIKRDGKMTNAEIAPSGTHKLYHNDEPLHRQMWYRMLHTIATDDWGRTALPTLARDPDTDKLVRLSRSDRISRVADKLQSDPKFLNEHYGATADRAGAMVATGDITARAAAMDHAAVLVDDVDAMVRPRGEIEGLVGHMLQNGRPPSIPALDKIPTSVLPDEVRGPELVPVTSKQSNILKVTNGLFSKFIGPQINWISRQPMFWFNYDKARTLFAPMAEGWARAGMSEDKIAELLHANARDYAIDDTIKYVHNPSLRSEMSTMTRNLAPFWFAQEQFYKRWARTLTYSPNAFRKAQLISGGLRNSGFTHKDPETGQEYFLYPGSGLVQDVLTNTLGLFGINAKLPVNAGLVGSTTMLSPGLQRLGLPNWGPLMVVPMNALAQIDPHFSGAINKLEGSQSADSGYLKALLPATVFHALEVAIPSVNAAAYASAQMQAIQYMEATGHGVSTPAVDPVSSMNIANPKPGDYVLQGGVGSAAYVYQPDGKWVLNTAHTLEALRDQVQNWSRILFLMRAVYGFAAPASPEDQFDPTNLDGQLQALMSQPGISFDQATADFLAAHPDATPYTVFQSQNTTGGFLPSTQAAQTFLDNNPALTSQHSLAAPYFIPEPDLTGTYSTQAYQEQMKDGLRGHKDVSTFYNQVVYESAANIYFSVENTKNQMIANHTGSTRDIDDQFTQWSEQFMQANPVFASLYGQGGFTAEPGTVGAGATGRSQIMADVGSALSDGAAPTNAQTGAIGVLYNNWVTWQSLTNNYGNPNQPAPSASEQLGVDEQFAQWLQSYVTQNPGVQPLVDRAIRPDLTQAIDSLAAQGTVITI